MSTGETSCSNVTNAFEDQKIFFEQHKMNWMSIVSPIVSDIKKFREDDGQFKHYVSIMSNIATDIEKQKKIAAEFENQKKKSKSPNKKSTSVSKNIDIPLPEVNKLLALSKCLLEQFAELGIKFVEANDYIQGFHIIMDDVIEKGLEKETTSQHKELGDIIEKIQRLGKITEEGYEKFNVMLKDTKKLLDKSENNVINSQALEQQLKSDIKILSDVSANSSPTFHCEASLQNVGRAVKEEMDYQRRKCNIMIFGHPNTYNNTDLYQEIKTLFHHIVAMPIDFKVLTIIGNNIIKVKLADEWQVRYLLQSAKKLKDTEYNKIFITPDRRALKTEKNDERL